MSAMKLSEGVEWAAHACALLAALPDGAALSAGSIAAFNELPRAYMAKHLQALAKAGVISSVRGARGGYRLARAPSEISLWDVREAIEGAGPDFRCANIRLRGPCVGPKAAQGPCAIAHAFWEAERAYRAALGSVTVADVLVGAASAHDATSLGRIAAWMQAQL